MKLDTVALACVLIGNASFGGAQERRTATDTIWTPAERQFRAAALNAIFAFRSDLRGDSTKIAECRVQSALQDSSTMLLPEFRRSLIGPLASQSTDRLNCSVYAFQREGSRVLWIESLIEVTRRGGLESLRARVGPAGGKTFEASFQLLVGTGYRLFERYEVKPVGPDGAVWRVTRYDLAGQEFIHANSRSGGPP